jgi:hypothetical protein
MSRIRADRIVDRAATGAPIFPNGAVITGVATATSFSGNITATGLTGTPDIAVGNITGVAATFTGVLTYEDVTNIDSIGIITARSGVDASGANVVLGLSGGSSDDRLKFHTSEIYQDVSSFKIISNTGGIVLRGGGTNAWSSPTGTEDYIVASQNGSVDLYYDNSKKFETTNTGVTVTGTLDTSGTAMFRGGLAEKYEKAGTTLGSQPNNPLSDGNVILFTGNESGNTTINFTGVHATLLDGETVSFTAILSPNNSGVINVVQVDGQAITVKWSGGSAPSAGSAGQDIYTFLILKTGTGTSDYTVFGAATNYA